ncbi:hypothetical protein JCM11641_006191 [Rhodosporidiobolus odoratus]
MKRKSRAEEEDWQPANSKKKQEGGTGATRKPGRTSVACAQCRQRKSECSLSGPACEGCLTRGDGESCSFQSFIWINNPDDLPSRQLKTKIDRLEEILKSLQSPPVTELPASPSLGSLPSPPLSAVPPLKHERAHSAPCILPAPPARPFNCPRSQAARALTRAILSRDDVPFLDVPGLSSLQLSAQLRHIEDQHGAHFPFFHYPNPSSLHAVISAEEYEQCVTAVLPTPQQAQLAISAFFSFANPFLQLVHPGTFLAQCDIFWRTGTIPEPHWLATYLMACGGGLIAAPDGGNGGVLGILPSGEAKELLARTWMDGARRVLAANNFMLHPTVEGIRALLILVQWWCGEGGRHLEQSLTIVSSIVAAIFDLQLNRDPDEVLPYLSPIEADLRRRLFWATYTFEAMIRPLLSNAPQAFDENDISTRFPDDDTAISGGAGSDIPTPLYSAAALNFRVNKILTRVKPPSSDDISRMLDELQALDESSAHDLLRSAMIRWGYIRLQRFANKLGITTHEHDELGSRYFVELLGSVDVALRAGGGTSTIVLLKIFSVALQAAVELCGTPYAIACTDPGFAQLVDLMHALRHDSFPSSLTRVVSRGRAVLEHLVPSPDEVSPLPASLYSATASEFSFTSKLTTPSTACSLPEDFAEYLPQVEAYLAPPPVPSGAQAGLSHFYSAQDRPTTSYPAISQPCPSALRATRPSLSVFTSMAPPAVANKIPTPIAISPWVDTAITPSRYVGNQSWERFL